MRTSKTLITSLKHIPEEDNETLWAILEDDGCQTAGGSDLHPVDIGGGWAVNVVDKKGIGGLSKHFWKVLDYAKRTGHDRVEFAHDEATTTDFQIFDWY